jgi:hypothetical protein
MKRNDLSERSRKEQEPKERKRRKGNMTKILPGIVRSSEGLLLSDKGNCNGDKWNCQKVEVSPVYEVISLNRRKIKYGK